MDAIHVVQSPPSRGAWIEIAITSYFKPIYVTSPPSRGAWIEIALRHVPLSRIAVAPLAGGVD